jgi:hypothetical protein
MTEEEIKEMVRQGICPVCKNELTHTEGCIECKHCGWSECVEA